MKLILLVLTFLEIHIAIGSFPKYVRPDKYNVSGNIILPYGDINEPFKAYVDSKNHRSRIDSYNGDAIIIYRGDEGSYGVMYKILYETINNTYNTRTCFKIPGESGIPVTAQDVLPDGDLYEAIGKESVDGRSVFLFSNNYTIEEKDNSYWFYMDVNTLHPVMLYFLGYDRMFGSHYDEYVVQYNSFSTDIFHDSIFDVPDNMKCISFPGPGKTNPMSGSLFYEFFGASGHSEAAQTAHIEEAFSSFKSKYNKEYGSAVEEKSKKFHFHHNLRYIHSKNRQLNSYKLAVNHLVDWSDDEIKKMRGYRNTGFNSRNIYESQNLKDIPKFVDWWLEGAVTRVKDQGICGSCWSFGTTGTLEGSYFIKSGHLIEFSEQALVDCSWGQGNNGCDGGESERAYEWYIFNKCIPEERSYGPYLMQDGYCHVNTSKCTVKIKDYFNVKSGDVDGLKEAIASKGPISVAIDASHKSFSFYSHGVYYEPDCGNTVDSLDHQVLAVGYGVQDGKSYWLVKNSWSTHWGLDGYVLMSDKSNNCGVATDASYAIIE